MNVQRNPSEEVLRKLHGFCSGAYGGGAGRPCRGDGDGLEGRSSVVVRGAGGPGAGGSQVGGGTVRIGGRVPWDSEVQYAYTTGYDSHGRVSMNHVVDERGYSVILNQRDPEGV